MSAYDCGDTGTLVVEIEDSDTGELVIFPGIVVQFDPDALDADGTDNVTDNSSEDDDDDVGTITQEDTCVTEAAEEYTVSIVSLPDDLEDCDFDDTDTDSDNVTENDTVTLRLEIDCSDADLETPTPQATATGTVGAARTVVVTSANQSLGCANTTIITITVRDAGGQPVAAGTVVNIIASIGAVSPTSGQTTADGSVFVFYTAPQNQGGTATITASAGTASGTANITVNCNAAPTQAPPPTTSAAGSIQPPNTGDGGLANSTSWPTYAGIALILVSVVGTLAVVRPRA